jgi:hypothetical protein
MSSSRFTREEINRMRRLAAMGNLDGDSAVDVTAGIDELELIHMTDVVEMQELLARAADELDRLYNSP